MKRISPYLLFVSFITLVAVFVTIVQQSYQRLIDSQVKVSSDIILKPIDPSLDTTILDDLEKRPEFLETITPPPVSSSSAFSELIQ